MRIVEKKKISEAILSQKQIEEMLTKALEQTIIWSLNQEPNEKGATKMASMKIRGALSDCLDNLFLFKDGSYDSEVMEKEFKKEKIL